MLNYVRVRSGWRLFVCFSTLGCVGYVELFRTRNSHQTEHPTRDFCFDFLFLLPPGIPCLCDVTGRWFLVIYQRGFWGLCAYVTEPPNQSCLIMLFNTQHTTNKESQPTPAHTQPQRQPHRRWDFNMCVHLDVGTEDPPM